MSTDLDRALRFWGKARPVAGAVVRWHPLAYHLLDVAAVGEALFEAEPRRLAGLASALGLRGDEARALFVYLLALHDVGKIVPAFQRVAPEAMEAHDPETHALLARAQTQTGRHDMFGFWLWRSRLLDLAPGLDVGVVGAAFGHHGVPPSPLGGDADRFRRSVPAPCLAAARTLAEVARALFLDGVTLEPISSDRVPAATHAIGGLAALCDWIGSDTRYFPYRAPELAPADYVERVARPAARRAVEGAGLVRRAISPALGFARLTGRADPPSPMQATCLDACLPAAPVLVFVEDMTGAGKTEAALLLANRLMARGDATGVFVALPTMATANAMFGRVGDLYRRLFAVGERPSLALAHGRADLHPAFRASLVPSTAAPAHETADERDAGGAECAAFFADDRRKALFADVGVGTFDQALLAALCVRHQPARLAALADKVLIVDEVHAADSYMIRALETLIALRAAAGAPTILMSATMPAAMKARLLAAHRAGVDGVAVAASAAPVPYPALGLFGADTAVIHAPATRPGLARRVVVSFARTLDEFHARIAERARAGLAVGVVRNTVSDAVATAEVLRGMGGLRCGLFHARFALADRLAIEDRIIARFGPAEQARGTRAGRILVATQVIEQSLDIDFDWMASDLAPIDLLIQRAGRLQRHARGDRPVPELLVLAPEATDAAGANWLHGDTSGGTRFVYRDAARLWRTARLLEEAGAIDAPGDLRRLVDDVYGDDVAARIPAGLIAALDRAEGTASGDRAYAALVAVDPRRGFVREGGWAEPGTVSARLGEPTVTLALCRRAAGRLVPWARDPDPRRAWSLSEVSMRRRALADVLPEQDAREVDAVGRFWPVFEDRRLAVIGDDGRIEELTTRRGAALRYHGLTGLLAERS